MSLVDIDLATVEDRLNALEPDGTKTDPFKLAASKAFQVPYDEVTKAQREVAKQEAYRHLYSVNPNHFGNSRWTCWTQAADGNYYATGGAL